MRGGLGSRSGNDRWSRPENPGSAAAAVGPATSDHAPLEAESVPPKGSGFVFLDVAGSPVPGLVVEQRRTERGWRVLLAVVEGEPDRTRSVSVRWVDACRVRPARPS